jgi:hypothetical protein
VEIQESRTYRPLAEGIRWNVPTAERFGMRPRVEAPLFAWDLPEGWVPLPASQFRQADFRITARPGVECYLSVVQGGALANLNRWRNQMGKPPFSEAEVQDLPKRGFFGTEAYYVEMEGTLTDMSGSKPDSMMVAQVLEAPQQTLTLKMVGPRDSVQTELENFAALAASFRLGGNAAGSPPQGSRQVPGQSSNSLSWLAPDGWREAPTRMMTEVVFNVGEGTSCWISILGSDGGGSEANIQRWRGEMSGASVTARESIGMFGRQGTLIQIDGAYAGGSAGPPMADAVMLAVTCSLGDQTVFVKMIGPHAEVLARRGEFLEFCGSLSE